MKPKLTIPKVLTTLAVTFAAFGAIGWLLAGWIGLIGGILVVPIGIILIWILCAWAS